MSDASTVSQENQNGNGQTHNIGNDVERGRGGSCPDVKIRKRRGLNFFDNSTPLADQVGGDHYLDCTIQPFPFNYHTFGVGAALGEIINRVLSFYATRDLEELVKIRHECAMLIHLEEESRKCKEAGTSCLPGICSGDHQEAAE